MASLLEDERLWLQQISSQDLARTLVREYLYQHNMFKTLSCFEVEDKQNSKKINKSTLIKMLCINNLVVNNKKLQKQKQSKSFLLLLVQYLRGKFQDRIKRQDYSDTVPPSQKNQKQFSMNGDKLLTKQIIEGNKIKQKNLVNTKRKQNEGKTITQEGFYKKKDAKNQYEDISYAKKSSNAIRQQKRPSNSRPSTANPMLQPKKQEKQKVQAIYSKLNTQNIEKQSQKKDSEEDPYSVRLNVENEEKRKDKKIQNLQGSRERSIHNNSAIGRNNKLQSSGNTKQLREQKKILEKRKQQHNQLPIQSKVNERYSQFDQKQVKSEQTKVQTFSQNNIDKYNPSSRRNQVQQEYFDEFEEQKPQKVQNKNKLQTVPEEESYLKVVKNTLTSERKQQQPKEKIQKKVQKMQQIIQSLQPKKINDVKQQDILPKKVQEYIPIKKNQEQPSYQPSNNMKRGGMKLLRKGKELTKQQDATQMIGKGIKLLPDNIKPNESQNNINDLTKQNKDSTTDIITETPPVKFIKIEQKSQEQKPKQEKKKQSLIPTQQTIPSTTVRQLKLKKKAKNAQQQPKISSKFKFDENFVDEPLNGKKQKYLYEKFSFLNMVIKHELKPKDSNIILENKINYTLKPTPQNAGGNPYAQGMIKKKNQKPLTTSKAEELKKIVFRQASPYLPKAWHQGFILSPFQDTFYGLKQIQGGPCGIIAAVQCYYLKHLIYLSKPINENDLKSELRREICLVAALADILWKVKGKSDKIVLVIPSNRNFSGPKLQLSNMIEVQIDATSFQYFYQTFWSYKSSFIGQANHGVTAIIYSIVMTKGIDNIYNQVDMKQNPLIGNHGHCTQELVNLFISGQASSNCFDGKKQLQDNFTLHGINQKSQFGFLTVYQTLGYLEVGKNLKNPLFPIWIISKQFHYHVIFGNHYLISENNDCQKFDLIYFDGLYTCDKFIRLTFDQVQKDEFGMLKDTGAIDKLPLIQQVLLKKWGRRKTDWNGSTKIL